MYKGIARLDSDDINTKGLGNQERQRIAHFLVEMS